LWECGVDQCSRKVTTQDRKHPKSYKLNSLNQDTKVIIEKSCVVSFSISKIKFDNILCDVVSIDACHLFLRMTWQYDKNIIYYGEHITYTLSIKEKCWCWHLWGRGHLLKERVKFVVFILVYGEKKRGMRVEN
jgi:hypothetical protein